MNYFIKALFLASFIITCFGVSAQSPSYKAGFLRYDSSDYIGAKILFRQAIDEHAALGNLDSAAAAGYYTHRVLFILRDFEWDSIYVADTLAELLAPFGKTGEAVLTQCKGEASFFALDLDYCADQLDKAYPLLQESSPIDQFLVENRQMRAFVYADYGELDQALATMKEAVSDAENRFGLDGKTTGFTYRNLGLIHSYRDELPASAEAYRKALEILNRHLLPSNPNIPTQYINLAELYMQQSRHDLALETFTKAFNHEFIKDNKNYTRIYLPYSNWLSQVGLHEESLVWAKRADSIYTEKYGETADGRLDGLLNLASAYLNLGRGEEAAVQFETAVQICESRNSGPLLYAKALQGVGLAQVELGQSKKANGFFENAALVLAKTDQAATSQINQLKIYQAEGERDVENFDAADIHISEVLDYLERDDLLHTRTGVDASVVAANIAIDRGDRQAALAHIRRSIRAIGAAKDLGITQHYAVAFAQPLSAIEGVRYQSDLHRDWLQLAGILTSALRSQQFDWVGSLDEESLTSFQYTFQRASYAANSGCANGDNQRCELALAYADLPRAIELRQRANKAISGKQQFIPDSLLTELRALERERLALDHSKFNENLRRERLARWNERNADFKDKLRRTYPGFYASNVEPLLLDVAAFRQNQSKEDRLFLSFTLDTFQQKMLRCALKGSDFRIDELSFGDRERQNISSFLSLLAARGKDGLAEQSHALFQSLFTDLPPEYLDVGQYNIAADGVLQSIPWIALLPKLPSQEASIGDWDWLAKTHDIIVADAVGSFANQQSETIQRQVSAIAPGFESEYQQRITSIGAAQANRSALIRTPWTLTTLNWLKEKFSATTSVGLEANEEMTVQLAKNTGILHLGTHAFYNEKDPLQSYFALTPVTAEAGNDGQLHAYELYTTQINADLAVLPACNSGSGEYDSSNGTLSLATAIRAAGCPTVVQSLWSIDDQQTNDLLKVFYEQLNSGQPTDKALANAQRMYLASAVEEYQHPYYWAGLTVVGSSAAMTATAFDDWMLWGMAILVLGLGGILFLKKRS